jgi:hypothetical protein
MRWAPQRWTFRVSSPNATRDWMARMSVYAEVDDGT